MILNSAGVQQMAVLCSSVIYVWWKNAFHLLLYTKEDIKWCNHTARRGTCCPLNVATRADRAPFKGILKGLSCICEYTIFFDKQWQRLIGAVHRSRYSVPLSVQQPPSPTDVLIVSDLIVSCVYWIEMTINCVNILRYEDCLLISSGWLIFASLHITTSLWQHLMAWGLDHNQLL
jgi:hypothetical protein